MAAVSTAYAETGQATRAEEAARWALQELQDLGGVVVEVECGTLRLAIAGSSALQEALLVLVQTGEYALAQLATDWIEDAWVYFESLMDLADVLLAAGRQELAREILSKCEAEMMEAATQARSVRSRRERVAVLNLVALLWKRRGELDRARTVIEEALTQAKRISPRSDRAEGMSELAQTLARCGASERALEVANQAIALTETVGDQPARIAALASLALALADAGRLDESQCVARKALAQAGRLTGKQDQVKALSDAASALAAAEANDEAAAAGQQAADLGRSLRRPANRAKALTEASRALAAAGLTTEATAAAGDARDLTPDIRRKGTRSHILSRLAIVWAAAGAASNAKKVATEALDVAKHTLRGQKVDVLCLTSEAMRQARDDREARSRAEKALALAQAIQKPVTQADALSKAGWALLGVGETDQALEAIQGVLASRDVLATSSLGPVALSRASRTLAAAGRIEQALIVWREALQWAREAGRTPVYTVLENGGNMLASLNQGETGWRAFKAVMAVESWWE
jgi:tetratricopeptide (TPR) repeat protein